MDRERDELPLPDFDHLPLEALRQRVRALDAAGLEALLSYEEAHGDRLPVTELLRHRLEDVRNGAPTSGGDPGGRTPETSDGTAPPASTSASSDAPPVNPPSHGDPTNPAQPRSTT